MRLQSFQPQFVHPYHFAFFHPQAHLSKIGYKQFDRFFNYTIHHGGWASATRLQAFAFNLDLDIEQFDKCMTTDDHFARVNYNKQVAVTEFGANSTPMFMIVNTDNGKAQRIVGAHPYSTFEDVINSLL